MISGHLQTETRHVNYYSSLTYLLHVRLDSYLGRQKFAALCLFDCHGVLLSCENSD